MDEPNEPKDPDQEGLIVLPPAPEDPFVINEANRRIRNRQARMNSNQAEQDYWEDKKQDADRRLIALLRAAGVPLDVAATIYWWNVTGLLVSIPLMVAVTFVTLFLTILPTSYNRKALGVAFSVGAAFAVVIGIESFLYLLDRILIKRYRDLYVGIVTVIMVACLFGGMMQFAMARGILVNQGHSQSQSGVILDDFQDTPEPDANSGKIQERVDRLNERGMILVTCSVDWFFGLFAFRCLINYLAYKPIMRALRDRKKAENKLRKLRGQNAAMSA